MGKQELIEHYLNAAKTFTIQKKREDKLLLILSVLRLIIFIGGLIAISFGFIESFITGLILLIIVTSAFFITLKIYSFHSEKREFLCNLVTLNQNEAKAVSGDLSGFETGFSYIDTGHDFSNDVDLFGNYSLFQYLNRTVTGYGRDTLAKWLSDPFALSPELISRQLAVRELSDKGKWRHEFLASGMKRPLEKKDIADLVDWLSEESFIKSSAVKKLLIWFLPVVAVISLLLVIVGIFHHSFFISIFLTNLLYICTGLRKTNQIHDALSRKYNYLDSLNNMLKVFEDELFTSQKLIDIKINIAGKGVSATHSVKKLSRLIQAFDSRMNILVSLVLNGLFLWDYQSIYKLEKWKAEYKNRFPVWLQMLGEVDAFISLGNYAGNNPGFVYPVKSDNNVVLATKKLGHQLIDESKRVCNDFSLEQKGTICIITGANMAGKSTFLRTVAVNYILAMTGAPVCAEEMKFTPVKLFTSMRTADSLSNNESYFYAELKRLKLLKEKIEIGEPVLFILDEILKGTNSADKSSGSGLFVKKMVELGATGVIATHDTSLGEMENSSPGKIFNKCFEIDIAGEIIKFDYRLQNGITKKMNAVLLMKQIGIIE
jgi:DNA mismatch repair ATPase MutS